MYMIDRMPVICASLYDNGSFGVCRIQAAINENSDYAQPDLQL